MTASHSLLPMNAKPLEPITRSGLTKVRVEQSENDCYWPEAGVAVLIWPHPELG